MVQIKTRIRNIQVSLKTVILFLTRYVPLTKIQGGMGHLNDSQPALRRGRGLDAHTQVQEAPYGAP